MLLFANLEQLLPLSLMLCYPNMFRWRRWFVHDSTAGLIGAKGDESPVCGRCVYLIVLSLSLGERGRITGVTVFCVI